MPPCFLAIAIIIIIIVIAVIVVVVVIIIIIIIIRTTIHITNCFVRFIQLCILKGNLSVFNYTLLSSSL